MTSGSNFLFSITSMTVNNPCGSLGSGRNCVTGSVVSFASLCNADTDATSIPAFVIASRAFRFTRPNPVSITGESPSIKTFVIRFSCTLGACSHGGWGEATEGLGYCGGATVDVLVVAHDVCTLYPLRLVRRDSDDTALNRRTPVVEVEDPNAGLPQERVEKLDCVLGHLCVSLSVAGGALLSNPTRVQTEVNLRGRSPSSP